MYRLQHSLSSLGIAPNGVTANSPPNIINQSVPSTMNISPLEKTNVLLLHPLHCSMIETALTPYLFISTSLPVTLSMQLLSMIVHSIEITKDYSAREHPGHFSFSGCFLRCLCVAWCRNILQILRIPSVVSQNGCLILKCLRMAIHMHDLYWGVVGKNTFLASPIGGACTLPSPVFCPSYFQSLFMPHHIALFYNLCFTIHLKRS